jgi:amidase
MTVNPNGKLTDVYNEALKNFNILIMPPTITAADPLPNPDDSSTKKMISAIGKLVTAYPLKTIGHPALAMPIGFIPSKADPTVNVPASMQVGRKYF